MSDKNSSNNNNAQGTVFANESAMMQQLQAMGMPAAMLANLTPQQRAAMLAMTASPEIQARATERVAHEDDWKQAKASAGGNNNGYYQWKNTRDDVFVKLTGLAGGRPVVVIEQERLLVSVNDRTIMDGPLFQAVNVQESTWRVVQGTDNDETTTSTTTLVISLRKAVAPMRWLSLYR